MLLKPCCLLTNWHHSVMPGSVGQRLSCYLFLDTPSGSSPDRHASMAIAFYCTAFDLALHRVLDEDVA